MQCPHSRANVRVDLSVALNARATGQRARLDRETSVLLGSRCRNCGTCSWPGTAVCRRCGSADLEDAAFGPQGTLVTYTRVWVERPGFEPGYVLGQVDLNGGVRVFAHVRGLPDTVKVPQLVRLVVGDQDKAPAFWFEPLRGAA
jgi:uncharacterized OB-fold protein